MIWNDKLMLGVRSIDDQHKVLVDIINELAAAIDAAETQEALIAILGKLEQYAARHFRDEEDLVLHHGINDQAQQANLASHQVFIDSLVDYRKRHGSGEFFVSHDLLDYLKTWLASHILGTDRRLADELRSLGVA